MHRGMKVVKRFINLIIVNKKVQKKRICGLNYMQPLRDIDYYYS